MQENPKLADLVWFYPGGIVPNPVVHAAIVVHTIAGLYNLFCFGPDGVSYVKKSVQFVPHDQVPPAHVDVCRWPG